MQLSVEGSTKGYLTFRNIHCIERELGDVSNDGRILKKRVSPEMLVIVANDAQQSFEMIMACLFRM